jgi:prenyl protein peptidase
MQHLIQQSKPSYAIVGSAGSLLSALMPNHARLAASTCRPPDIRIAAGAPSEKISAGSYTSTDPFNSPQVAYCFIYVLPLYAWNATRPSPTRSRDAPEAIRARIRAVTFSTTVCSVLTLLILQFLDASPLSPLHLMGYWPVDLFTSAKAVFLTALLFAGPLFENLVIDGEWREWTRLDPLKRVWADWPTWRNLVAGPVTEECLFRSAAVPLLLVMDSNVTSVIYLSPLVFGIAHVHHFYEFRITHPHVSLPAAVVRSVIQFSYTYLFGIYATFIFIRTGSLPAVILIHTFCNYMGLPRVWGQLEPYWLPQEGNPRSATVAMLTVAYYIILVGGLVGWWRNLFYLTDSPMRLVDL